jgi:hypothetical protein
MTAEDRIQELIKLASSVLGQRERFEHTCRAISVPVPEFREPMFFEVRPMRDQLRGMLVAVNAAPTTMGGLALDDTLSEWETRISEQYDRDCNTLSNHLCSFYSDND